MCAFRNTVRDSKITIPAGIRGQKPGKPAGRGFDRGHHCTRDIIASAAAVLTAVCWILEGCGAGASAGGYGQGSVTQSGGIGTAGSGPQPQPVTRQSFYFDTVCGITVYDMEDMSEENAGKAIESAFSLCGDYESLLSKTKEGTDIWNINHAGGEPVVCNPETVKVIQMGIDYGDLSGGAFDITVGKAEDLWDFHSDEPKVPDEAALQEAVSHVNYKGIRIDEDSGSVTMVDPEAEIDLGGIAKGYIADRVRENLKENGVTSAIISLGGNIECVGGKPVTGGISRSAADADGSTNEQQEEGPSAEAQDGGQVQDTGYFTIGIETPYADMSSIVGSTPVNDGTVVTSGVYERYFTVDGKEYHHILDVRTGYPADSDVLGVSIKSSGGHSADCDALATICLIDGSAKGKTLIDSMDGYEALFILRDSSIIKTDGFEFAPAEGR